MLDAHLLPLRNDGAVLRALREDDAHAYAEGTRDPSVRRYAHLPEPEYTEASVTELVRGAIREGLERGDLAVLAIADPATDDFAGSLVLFDVTRESAEIGFWMHPRHRGRGFARAALSLAVSLARLSGLARLTARTVPENRASQRVLERAGFVRGADADGIAPSGETIALRHYVRGVERGLRLPVETERLRLRPHRHDDAAQLQRVYSQPEVARYLLDAPWTAEVAAQKVAERLPKTDLDGEAGALALVIEHPGAPVGDVLLWLTDAERRVAEIGWVLDSAHGGRGLAREAVGAVLRLAFEHYRLHRVVAQMDARNTASAKLAAAVGMRQEAHLRQDWWSKGEWTDTLVFAMLASDRP